MTQLHRLRIPLVRHRAIVLALLLAGGLLPVDVSAAKLPAYSLVVWGYKGDAVQEMLRPIDKWAMIAAHEYRSLGLKVDGTVMGWATTNLDRQIPAWLSNVVQVTTGDGPSVALRADGTVVCWGWNEEGQTNVPSGLSNVVQVAAGYSHTLALTSDGGVVAWGNNKFYDQAKVPVHLRKVIAIAAAGCHSLAVQADGTVVAWGAGERDLGSGEEQRQCRVPAGLSNVVAVAAGSVHSLALRKDGTVVAWGGNYYGQSSVPMGLSNVVAIAAGTCNSLALKADGTVVVWGSKIFDLTEVPEGLSNVVSVAVGLHQAYALVSSQPPLRAVEVVRALESKQRTNPDVRLVRRYPATDVMWLCLRDADVRSDPVKALARLSELEGLAIEAGPASDLPLTSFQRLQTAPGLNSLSLNRMPERLSPKWAAALGRMVRLEELQLWNMAIETGAGPELLPLQNLRRLDLSGCRGVSRKVLQAVSGLPALEHLNLAGTDLTDTGLAILQRCARLQYLDLSNTAITENGLRELVAGSALRQVRLGNSQVPAAARQAVFAGTRIRIVTSLPAWDYSFELCRAGVTGAKPDEK